MKTHKAYGLQLAATDLPNHLGCTHLTQLQRKDAFGELTRPVFNDPSLNVLRERGEEHEDAYVDYLQKQGLSCIDLSGQSCEATSKAMHEGIDVIIQARLEDGQWMGYADILIKVPVKSKLGAWSYEVQDTKLAQETRPGAVLQLCLYAEMLEKIQGIAPESLHVVKPGDPFATDSYRFNDFRAYYNAFRNDLVQAVRDVPATYPNPVDQCRICAWWQRCDKQRRDDDHLSLVAGIRSSQIAELEKQEIHQLAELALAKKIKRPERGQLQGLLSRQQQALIQLQGREEKALKHKILLPVEEDRGFNKLPKRSDGDIYFDIEGDAFYPDGGLEYLLGYYYQDNKGHWAYQRHWASNRLEEKKAFEAFMQFVMKRWKKHPNLCIYHYAPYEPTALNRLSGTHAVYEREVAMLLRGHRLVDLHSVVKGALIASVERYSLKDLEKFAGFLRTVDLREASLARRHVECALELNDLKSITADDRQKVEGYNQDDCAATLALHEWLEKIRKKAVKEGAKFKRLEINDGESSDEKKEAATKAEQLRAAIIKQLPEDQSKWNEEHRAAWLLAHQVDYFDREERSAWWEYFAIRKLNEEDLLEHRKAIVGLSDPKMLKLKGREKNPTVRYRFPPQESDIHVGDTVSDVLGDTFGEVTGVSMEDQTIDIKKNGDSININPQAIQVKPKTFRHNVLADSLFKVAAAVRQYGFGKNMPYAAAQDLLMKNSPRFTSNFTGNLLKPNEDHVAGAIRLAAILDNSVLAIQGPPGSGKTYTGAMMIMQLVREGYKIGLTAVSHKAIRNLLAKLKSEAKKQGLKLTVGHKSDGSFDDGDDVIELDKNSGALEALAGGAVIGATAWLWASDAAENSLDYLFVDEAGQMSLTNVLAACRCTKNLILLGDPQQLEQPQQGSHPEGSDVAALTHLLDGKKTIADAKGIFIKTTRRLHPHICRLTSELYYESRLEPIAGLDRQAIGGKTLFAGSGLFHVPVEHKGNQSKSIEEAAVVKQIVNDLVKHGTWTDHEDKTHKIKPGDIAIVTPYNAQIAALEELLPGYSIGTVDKFQGQEAPVVIYSMASSSSQDAPRGMSFLYSPNRFNVATSRAMCICILVASPLLFEPECKSIDQMRWANAMCRYKELAHTITMNQST